MSHLCYGLVTNGLFKLGNREAFHGSPERLEDAGLVAPMLSNLLSFGFQNGHLLLKLFVRDHRLGAQAVDRGLEFGKGDIGEDFCREDGVAGRERMENPRGKIPRGALFSGCHGDRKEDLRVAMNEVVELAESRLRKI